MTIEEEYTSCADETDDDLDSYSTGNTFVLIWRIPQLKAKLDDIDFIYNYKTCAVEYVCMNKSMLS